MRLPVIQVLEGKNVDIIEPFPLKELATAVGWMHCHKTITFGDDGPQTDEEIYDFLKTVLTNPNTRSWAIVDRDNLSKTRKDLPLVGIIYFERVNPLNGYFHVTSHRRAWGTKLASPALTEQAGKLVINEMFRTEAALQRVSVAVLDTNKAAKNLASRLGFEKEGLIPNMVNIKGTPTSIVHMGIVREKAKEVTTNG